MRPLDPQDRDAPVSALIEPQGFWDHLGSTRAEEYAQDDILPISAVPIARDTVPETHPSLTHMLQRGEFYHGRLDDTLQAVDYLSVDTPVQQHETSEIQTKAAHSGELSAIVADARFAASVPLTAPSKGKLRTKRYRITEGRIGYRLQRIWLTPLYRAILKYGVPAAALVAGVALYFSNEANRQHLSDIYDHAYSAFVDRPEFMVTSLRWPEVTPELDAALRARLDVELPQSSFRLDLDHLRESVEALDWVRSAELRLLADGILALNLVERMPAILWRSEDGLVLLDAEGVRVAVAASRDVRPDLPLIAGLGADAHIREALDLFDAAAPLGSRLHGLVRVGERRWDVVLDRDQRIRLPETGALAALERVIALEQAQDLLSRDLLVADLRNPARPVLQINAGAMETLREIRLQALEALQ
ncbi:MAG: cell division protein FtsQ/DivIB [Roseinatronobacter sp.]